MSEFKGFGPGLIDYYLDLEQHNNREWFLANRASYDSEVALPLKALALDLAADYAPVKVFRPYRNNRFWPELPPLNEHASLVANVGSTAVYYLRIDADGMLVNGGSHDLSRDQLALFRTIVATQDGAAEVRSLLSDAAANGFRLAEANQLKTAPRGYSKDHPNIDLLRLRSLSLSRHFPPGKWLASRESYERIVEGWQAVTPWVTWLRVNVPIAQLN
ncbi:MAG: DUF2461 family protein [Actinomycetota bacterium]|nr:DUF2461 family protein [Actinomycetota bacterium]